MKFVAYPLVLLALFMPQRLGIRLNPTAGGGGTLLTDADITYTGAIRTYSSGPDLDSAYGGIGGRVVGGHVHIFMWGNGAGHSGGPNLIECDINGLTPNTDYTVAPRINSANCTDWDNIMHGKRQSWTNTGCGTEQDLTFQASIMGPPYWNEATHLLYWPYHISYTDQNMWSLGASSLDNPVGPVTTAYGPWRVAVTDGFGATRVGDRSYWIGTDAAGQMASGGISKSGNGGIPWGPSFYGGADFPTTATTGGCPGTLTTMPDHYIDYYPPNNIDRFGLQTGGPLYAFTYQNAHTAISYITEVSPPGTTVTKIDPGTYGYGSWSDEASSVSGALWFNGTHKQGVLFPGVIIAATGGNDSDCTAGVHEFYRNAGGTTENVTSITGGTGAFTSGEIITEQTTGYRQLVNSNGWDATNHVIGSSENHDWIPTATLHGTTSGTNATVSTYSAGAGGAPYLNVIVVTGISGGTGAFTVGETITESTTGFTQTVSSWTSGTSSIVSIDSTPNLDLTVGHTVTGSISNTTATLTAFHRFDVCNHTCGGSWAVTGPGTTKNSSVIIIMDPATLNAVKAGATDYTQVASEIIDVNATYGARTEPVNPATAGPLQAGALNGGYYHPTTNGGDWYLFANTADDTIGPLYNPGLIQVFHINDSAAPEPTFFEWLWNLAPKWLTKTASKPTSLLERPR